MPRLLTPIVAVFLLGLLPVALAGCAKPPESTNAAAPQVTATSGAESLSGLSRSDQQADEERREDESRQPVSTELEAAAEDVAEAAAEEPEPIELALAGGSNDKPADISFADLKLDVQPASRFEDAHLTDKIKAYEGKPIRIRGVMWPTFQQRGIKEFVLLMNQECKFGSAKDPIWCNIRVHMDEDETANFTIKPVTVEGVLQFDVMKGPKYDLSIYEMKEAKVVD